MNEEKQNGSQPAKAAVAQALVQMDAQGNISLQQLGSPFVVVAILEMAKMIAIQEMTKPKSNIVVPHPIIPNTKIQL